MYENNSSIGESNEQSFASSSNMDMESSEDPRANVRYDAPVIQNLENYKINEKPTLIKQTSSTNDTEMQMKFADLKQFEDLFFGEYFDEAVSRIMSFKAHMIESKIYYIEEEGFQKEFLLIEVKIDKIYKQKILDESPEYKEGDVIVLLEAYTIQKDKDIIKEVSSANFIEPGHQYLFYCTLSNKSGDKRYEYEDLFENVWSGGAICCLDDEKLHPRPQNHLIPEMLEKYKSVK